MSTTLKKWLPIAGIVSCSMFGMLTASEYSHSGNMNQSSGDMHSSQCAPDPCAPKPCEPDPCCPRTPAYGYDVPCNFAILHDAGPRVCDGLDLFLTVDFLWWTAREDGLAYATSGVNTSTSADGGSGSLKHPDFEWSPGFKVGAGMNLWHDGWDAYVQYTWLHNEGGKSTTSANRDSNGNLIGTNSLYPTHTVGSIESNLKSTYVDQTQSLLTKATGRWDLHLNVIDLELGKNYFVSRYLTLRPFFGFKGTWQHQDYKVRYYQMSTQAGTLTMNRMRQDHDMWGIGIRFGVNTAWHFTRDWSLFGDWALTPLHTKFDIERKDRSEESVTATGERTRSITTRHQNNTFYSLKGVLEAAFGVRWDAWFGCNDTYHFRVQAAWEEQLWFGQNNMIGVQEEAAHGDMMLHGLTIKARFDF